MSLSVSAISSMKEYDVLVGLDIVVVMSFCVCI